MLAKQCKKVDGKVKEFEERNADLMLKPAAAGSENYAVRYAVDKEKAK